ncbi:MAG: hypothetical protein K6C11_04575, partial [Bacilli bacterium]|nr:hypothetical protein [Bacilli bacterium]
IHSDISLITILINHRINETGISIIFTNLNKIPSAPNVIKLLGINKKLNVNANNNEPIISLIYFILIPPHS